MPILSKSQLLTRLRDDLIVSPVLDLQSQVSEGSINVRLGTTFIDTRLRAFDVIDPKRLSVEEIQRFQEKIQLAFGSPYVLHPRRLVLASTFEFISCPPDLCGFVLSRSRYGRAGLMVATATYVQPGWSGCLTLEMFNYGEFPIRLYCGSQVAQLVIQTADPKLAPQDLPRRIIPMGPQFTRMDNDSDWTPLKSFEQSWDD